MTQYHTLAIWEGGKWSAQFGAYDLDDVNAERDSYRQQGYMASQIKLIKSGDKQDDIDRAMILLNKRTYQDWN